MVLWMRSSELCHGIAVNTVKCIALRSGLRGCDQLGVRLCKVRGQCDLTIRSSRIFRLLEFEGLSILAGSVDYAHHRRSFVPLPSLCI